MEREIANVAAACAMHGFRYMAFPPIVFDAPVRMMKQWADQEPVRPGDAIEPSPAASWITPDLAPPAAAEAAPNPRETTALSPPAIPPPGTSPRPAPIPERRPAPMPEYRPAPIPERRSAPIPEHRPTPLPDRRFALLADVSAELRRQAAR